MGRKSEVGNIMLPVEHWWQKNESQRGETNSSAKFESCKDSTIISEFNHVISRADTWIFGMRLWIIGMMIKNDTKCPAT